MGHSVKKRKLWYCMSHLIFRIVCMTAFFFMYSPRGVSQKKETIALRIDVSKTYQVIENFGASDAWSCQFVGNWPDTGKNAIADWLFSMDTLPNGNPKGIGLSLWRFNIGAGSTQQGAASGIKDEWRRAESFMEDKGYSWQRQQGQLWFLKAAQQRGVQQFLGFFNSPPAQLTRNRKTYADSGRCNISPDKYIAFAGYAADVIKHIKQHTGIGLDYISPVNEPQWDWSDGGQEGCPYTNKDIYGVVKAFNAALQKNRLTTKLLVTESGHHKYLLSDEDKPGKGNQVSAFFDASSSCYIGGMSGVDHIVASHSYFTSSPFPQAMAIRKKIAAKVAAVSGLRYWQSEYCILGDNAGDMQGGGRDTGMNAALYVAAVIYTDLVAGNAAAWQWWLAISPYNYKDGLIYIDKNKNGGNYHDSKMLWALGNYSRFVRPGMKRVHIEAPATNSLLVSAWKDEKHKKLVVVVVNRGTAAQSLVLNNPAGNPVAAGGEWNTYTTSDAGHLEKHMQPAGTIDILPMSIVTIEMAYH